MDHMFDTSFALSWPSTTKSFITEALSSGKRPDELKYDWKALRAGDPDMFSSIAKTFMLHGLVGWLERSASFDFYSDILPSLPIRDAAAMILADTPAHFKAGYPAAIGNIRLALSEKWEKGSGHIHDGTPMSVLCYGDNDNEKIRSWAMEKALFLAKNGPLEEKDHMCISQWPVMEGDGKESMPLSFLNDLIGSGDFFDRFANALASDEQRLSSILGRIFRGGKKGLAMTKALIDKGVLGYEHLSPDIIQPAALPLLADKLGLPIPVSSEAASGVLVGSVEITTKSSIAKAYFGTGRQLIASTFEEARVVSGGHNKVADMLASETIGQLMRREESSGTFLVKVGKARTAKASTFAGLHLFEPSLAEAFLAARPEEAEALIKGAVSFCDSVDRLKPPPELSSVTDRLRLFAEERILTMKTKPAAAAKTGKKTSGI